MNVSESLLGAVVAGFTGLLVAGSPLSVSPVSEDPADPDSLGATVDVERDGEMLRIRGVYVNGGDRAGELGYQLDVRRSGSGGETTSRQSGTFTTRPQQTDTLSTVRVSAGPGARVAIELRVQRGDRLIDATRRAWTVK